MNPERTISRRSFLKEAIVAGAAFSALPRASYGQENAYTTSNEAPPASDLPSFINPETITPVPTEYSPITETHEFISNNLPYKADVPINWINQPGLLTDIDPGDIFLGPIPYEQQTMALVRAIPVEEGTTLEGYFNNLFQEITHFQELQHEETGTPTGVFSPAWGSLYKDMAKPENYRVGYPNGEKDCWKIEAFIPTESDEPYCLVNTGFLKDGNAWQFEFSTGMANIDAWGVEDNKFIAMLNSVELT